MTPKRIYYLLLGVLVLLIIGVGASLYFTNQLMQNKASELRQADLDNQVADKKLKLLQNAKKELTDNANIQKAIDEALPKTKNQADVVAQLYSMAADSNIKISSITFPASTLGEKKAAPSSSTDSKPDTSTNNSPSSATTGTSGATQTKPVSGITGVSSVDVALTFAPTSGESISYSDMLKFLSLVEQNRRTMLINTLQISPDVKNGGVNFSINLKLFVKS